MSRLACDVNGQGVYERIPRDLHYLDSSNTRRGCTPSDLARRISAARCGPPPCSNQRAVG